MGMVPDRTVRIRGCAERPFGSGRGLRGRGGKATCSLFRRCLVRDRVPVSHSVRNSSSPDDRRRHCLDPPGFGFTVDLPLDVFNYHVYPHAIAPGRGLRLVDEDQ